LLVQASRINSGKILLSPPSEHAMDVARLLFFGSCLCVLLVAGPLVAADGAGAQSAPPQTPIDSEPDDTDAENGRIVPSEQVPFGIKTTYGNADLDRPTGGSGVTVAVVDTGVDRSHPDLRDRVTLCRDFTGESVENDSCADANGHGTHVAGTIAADGGPDDRGIYGVAPSAEIQALKACEDDGRCRADSLARAVRAATDAGADVVALSLGGRPEPRIQAAIDHATANGVVVVAAAGNSGPELGSILYPAAHPNVIAVSAVGPREEATVDPDAYQVPEFSARGVDAPFSNETDGSIELAAVGVDVLSPVPGSDYGTKTGTSMAAPHVAGLVAKILGASADPRSIPELRAELHERARRYDVREGEHARPGYDPASGFGIPTVSAPRPEISVSPAIPIGNESFLLSAAASRSDAPLVAHEWDTTGDGEFDQNGEQIELALPAGTRSITLRVTDAENASATTTTDVFVNDRPRLSVAVPEVRAGENATLAATVENEFGETTVSWTLPDGTTATGETVTHQFAPGESTVEVTVTDEYGASTTETVTVTAVQTPEDQGPIISLAVLLVLVAGLIALGRRG
jgi:subtilisin